jgi:dTDP-4-amino-4,6-dideoxygalactose transaminase
VSTTQIPFFGTAREFAAHREPIVRIVEETLATGHALQGPAVKRLEGLAASRTGRRHGIAVNSCTDALYFALVGAGIRAGDEVIVPDFSFVATASCVIRLGAVPKFADIDELGNIDLESAAKLINDRTRAVIIVHLYGQMSDPQAVEAFARRHDLVLIEDAAQAFGGDFNGRPAGSVGVASCLSFDPTKPVSAPGSGGLLLTDDDALADRVKRLRYHGKTLDGDFSDIGFNSQMSTLVAAVLCYKLDLSDGWMAERRAIAGHYLEHLDGLGMTLPLSQTGSGHVYHKFVVRTPYRDQLRDQLQRTGIQTMIHYSRPLHREPCFAGAGNVGNPVAERFSREVLSLPIHPFLERSEVAAVSDGVRRFFHTSPRLMPAR